MITNITYGIIRRRNESEASSGEDIDLDEFSLSYKESYGLIYTEGSQYKLATPSSETEAEWAALGDIYGVYEDNVYYTVEKGIPQNDEQKLKETLLKSGAYRMTVWMTEKYNDFRVNKINGFEANKTEKYSTTNGFYGDYEKGILSYLGTGDQEFDRYSCRYLVQVGDVWIAVVTLDISEDQSHSDECDELAKAMIDSIREAKE